MVNSINSRHFSQGEKLWSFFLPFSFLLAQYGYGFGNPMLTYCFIFALFCVVGYRKFPTFNPLSIYTLWYVAVLIGTVLIFGHVADRPYLMHLIQILVSGFGVTIVAKHLDKDALYVCWKILGLIVCVVVAYQFFQIFVLNQYVKPIRLMPVSSEALKLNENWTDSSHRPLAFFTEPSMVVAFLTPVLLFAQQKKELLVAIIVSVAILLTGSTSGVIALAIMWGLSIFSYKLSKTTKIFIITLSIAAVVAFLNLSIFRDSLDKILYELSGDSSNMNTRVLRGWMIYSVLDTRSQIFGISDHDLSSFIYGNASEFTWQTGYEDNFYLNAAQLLFIRTGLAGAVLYVWMLIRLWRSTNKIVKPYLVFVIVSMFFENYFFINGMFVMQYVVLLSYLEKFESKKVVKVKSRNRVQKQYVQEIH